MSIRLIHTETLRLKAFTGGAIPKYAILSHTWIPDGEVSFQEMMAIAEYPEDAATKKSGYKKIVKCCQKARSHGYMYTWIDTCCIDKTSSAELSEAINSMYKWYGEASICYVYLWDVPAGQDLSADDSEFRASRWFTRGWTLQELLAPSSLAFYDQDWGILGQELKQPGCEESGWKRLVSAASVAERMSWAAGRITIRVEDMVYCLLGIFDVNMPLLYGEGEKAFVRLQEEIIKEYDDHSLLFWHDRSLISTGGSCFARRPADFGRSGDARVIGLTRFIISSYPTI
ncbi:hypothetical protein DL769_001098 [Monosporascus sp. CRB-8-3]|nr:hypothetical protein DL769_001098 [Monosporascus sp. CRB-8-3]